MKRIEVCIEVFDFHLGLYCDVIAVANRVS